MEEGFMKGDSNNLPHVDMEMVHNFYAHNSGFVSAEIRNIKTKRLVWKYKLDKLCESTDSYVVRAAREEYGDSAIGFVQVKRKTPICTVKGKVNPEHKIRARSYNVVVIINETTEEVLQCQCVDCPAAAGGCKHKVAFLMWLHRRSEEPPVTATTSYWRAPSLASLGKQGNKMSLQDIATHKVPELSDGSADFLQQIKSVKSRGPRFDMFHAVEAEELSIHNLMLEYVTQIAENMRSPDGSVGIMQKCITHEACTNAELNTRNQSATKLWFDLRFGRIIASKLYEAAKCKTSEGSLFEAIMRASEPFEAEYTKRGKALEQQVINEVEKMRNIKIRKCVLCISSQCPIFGASPDGISGDYCIEVKCLSKIKTMDYYIKDDVINMKFQLQMQLQMLLAKKQKALFCMAAPSFETTKQVLLYDVQYNEVLCKELMDLAATFWKTCIYPKLVFEHALLLLTFCMQCYILVNG